CRITTGGRNPHLEGLNRLSRTAWLVLGLICVGVVGYVDIMTGYEVGFSLFYLIPIVLVSWFGGSPLGLTIAMAGAVTWGVADVLAGGKYSIHWTVGLNRLIRLTLVFVKAVLVDDGTD